jgi:hypothetical protein
MAELAKGLLRKTMPELELSLEGKLEEHATVVKCGAPLKTRWDRAEWQCCCSPWIWGRARVTLLRQRAQGHVAAPLQGEGSILGPAPERWGA